MGERLLHNEGWPLVMSADQLPEDERLRRSHEQWMASLALSQTVEVDQAEPESLALSELLARARKGDIEARASIDSNAHITVIETIIKDGNVTAIRSQRTPTGLAQHGHSYRDIQTNTLTKLPLSPTMRARSELEALNCVRIEEHADRGLLKDYWYVVCSLVSDNTTTVQSRKDGFFVDTMTAVFQATTEDDQGILTESGFVAGVENTQGTEGGERHDIAAVRALLADWGVEGAEQLTTTEMLGKGVLIHKSLMRGISDVVRWYDDKLGSEFFFGDRRPRQDYQAFTLNCLRRNDSYQVITDAVVADLLAQSEGLGDEACVQLLYDLAKKHAVKHAFTDRRINARKAFGAEAAIYIEQGRRSYEAGDIRQMEYYEARAQDTAETTACGGGSGPKEGDADGSNGGQPGGEAAQASAAAGAGKNSSSETSSSWQWKLGVCRISNCPTRPKSTKIGPCSVCWQCQQKFDRGENPVTAYASRRPEPAKSKPTKKQFALAA